MEDKEPTSPYGIICKEHGKQGLSKENYDLQLSMPNRTWVCPIGECYAIWDDERYEKSESNNLSSDNWNDDDWNDPYIGDEE